MKFVFLGYDFMLPVAHRLIQDGHDLIGIMSFECDQIFNFNLECQSLAAQKSIPFIQSPVTDIHIDSFIDDGAKLFLSAGYPFKIPAINDTKAYGINIHPSYLPHARGIMPVPYILMSHDQNAAGVTIHKLATKFDQGDILAQHKIPLTSDETVETYSAKTLLAAPDMLSETIKDIDKIWNTTSPQDESIAFTAPMPTDDMRTINWDDTVQNILKTSRAFGRFGCLATINDKRYSIFALHGWEDDHNHTPGTPITLQSKIAIIAAKDGYICLTDFAEIQL